MVLIILKITRTINRRGNLGGYGEIQMKSKQNKSKRPNSDQVKFCRDGQTSLSMKFRYVSRQHLSYHIITVMYLWACIAFRIMLKHSIFIFQGNGIGGYQNFPPQPIINRKYPKPPVSAQRGLRRPALPPPKKQQQVNII